MSTTIDNLRARREAAGVTQVDLARTGGVSLNTVRNAEWGLPVHDRTADRIESALADASAEDPTP